MIVDKAPIFLEIMSFIMLVGIVIVYGMSAYWNTKFLLMTHWRFYSALKLFGAIVGFLAVIGYGYLIIQYLTGNPIDISFYGGVILRPIVFLAGGSMASNARARISLLMHGGESWTLRKSKKL